MSSTSRCRPHHGPERTATAPEPHVSSLPAGSLPNARVWFADVRILILGAGGVGTAAALIAARREFPSQVVVADYELPRAEKAVLATGDARFWAARVDASDQSAVEAMILDNRVDLVLGATDPRFTMPIFRAALSARVHYMDMAMSLSQPHPAHPFSETGVKLGDEQFALNDEWVTSGRIALVGMGVEPGLADVFARYAADNLFAQIDEVGVRDGANLVVEGYGFAPTFSIWTTIEECLNPPVIYEKGLGWFTTEPFSDPETFDFPEGIGPVECVNVEHEEVLLIPRWVDVEPGDVQVRPGARVYRDPEDPAQDRSGPHREGARRGRRGQPPRRRRRLFAGPCHPGGPDKGKNVRRALGEGDRKGRPAALGVPLPRRGQRLVDARIRCASRRLADGGKPRRGDGTHRQRVLDRRRSTRSRSFRLQAVPRPPGR